MNKLFMLALTLLFVIPCLGQEKVTLKSRVVDSKTRNDVPGVTVQLLSSDSTVIETLVANNHWTRDDQEGYSSIFQFDVPYYGCQAHLHILLPGQKFAWLR